jgi:hypothetical protein
MIWSKVKKEIKEALSENVNKAIDIHMTGYAGSHSDGRAWITIYGEEVANFSTHESYVHFGKPWNELTKDEPWARHEKVDEGKRTPKLLIEKGEFSRGDFTDSCYQYLSLNISEAQQSNHPIIRMLAALDKRTGKRKLETWIKTEINPLVKYFLEFRIGIEKTTR